MLEIVDRATKMHVEDEQARTQVLTELTKHQIQAMSQMMQSLARAMR